MQNINIFSVKLACTKGKDAKVIRYNLSKISVKSKRNIA